MNYNKLLSKITNYYCYRYSANYYQVCDKEKNSLLTAIAIIMLMESSNNNDYYILLVEDEKDILDLFTEYLSSNGFNTISFQNPMEALNYFYQNQSNCSLVITDYKMPQISGIDLIKKIREKDTADYKIKTIVISAFIKDNLPYDKSYILTVDKILEKPVYLDRLKKVILELLSTIDIRQKAQ